MLWASTSPKHTGILLTILVSHRHQKQSIKMDRQLLLNPLEGLDHETAASTLQLQLDDVTELAAGDGRTTTTRPMET